MFMGTPEFALPSLATLHETGYSPVAVVTAPDKPRGRGQALSPTPVKEFALARNLPVLQPESLRDVSFLEQVRDLQPDLFVVVAFRILPPELFTIPRLGAFNLHASLLPRYRGAAPINWAIINGETETGVTTFFLEQKVDTGNIILQRRIPIAPEDDAGSLHDKLAALGAEAVLETVMMIERGNVRPEKQDDSRASPAPKIFKEDCVIRWDQPAARIHNFVRGLSPFPAAFTVHAGKTIKLYRTRAEASLPGRSPGEVLVGKGTMSVATSDGSLAILELQQEGRKRMGTEEFLRGYRLAAGEKLGEQRVEPRSQDSQDARTAK